VEVAKEFIKTCRCE